jgi:DNA (cytosine-5)-methyltransferase 1
MGFPDSFQIPVSDTQAYRQFGNSVVVPVVSSVAKLMTASIRGQQVPFPNDTQMLIPEVFGQKPLRIAS